MKIWLINNYNMLPEHGQLTRNYSFGVQLKKLGHEPVAFVGSHPHNTRLQLIEGNEKYKVYQEKPFPWVLIKTRNYEGSKKSRIISMFEFYRNMRIAAEHFEKPDAIIGSSAHPLAALLAIQLGNKFGCKKIVEIRDLWPESIVAYGILGANNPIVLLMKRLEKWLYVYADAIIFTFGGGYDYIKEQGWDKEIPKSKVHYINNGIDLAQFDFNKKNFTINDEDLENEELFKVIYTGSIRKVNDLNKLVDVAKKVQNPKIKFLVWGDGDELPKLKERVKNENITNVVFKGRIEKKYIPYINSKADLNFAHNNASSLFRFGISFNKIFDYLASGKPILCDFYAKFNPIISLNAGVSVDTGDINDIAIAIDKLSYSEKQELLKYNYNARNGVKDFDFFNLTKKLVGVINSINN